MAQQVAAIVVAAGRGQRAGGDISKQYRTIAGEPVVRRALARFALHPAVQLVQPVIHPNDADHFEEAASGLSVLTPVFGGATRQDSVRAGLEALLSQEPDIVLIHDAARPFLSDALVTRAIEAGARGAAVPALAVTDTVKVVSNGAVVETLARDTLRTIQTPQAFAFAQILGAHRKAVAAGRHDFTDDSALAEWAGISVTVFEGEAGNTKLTTAEDFSRLQATRFQELGDVRTASGYDVHAFGDGDHVMLGGIRIAHPRGLSGHSDADVALHALVDAILGTLADGDIGSHFPPSDPQWRGASSDQFLAHAVERVRRRGGRIAHLDVTLVCEAPKISPHRDTMRARIAEIAGLPIDRVAVKATTSEKLGFIGRGEGIEAYATATVRLPWDAP